jgi:hypothetical protein
MVYIEKQKLSNIVTSAPRTCVICATSAFAADTFMAAASRACASAPLVSSSATSNCVCGYVCLSMTHECVCVCLSMNHEKCVCVCVCVNARERREAATA